jgi:hypothetical protein
MRVACKVAWHERMSCLDRTLYSLRLLRASASLRQKPGLYLAVNLEQLQHYPHGDPEGKRLHKLRGGKCGSGVRDATTWLNLRWVAHT